MKAAKNANLLVMTVVYLSLILFSRLLYAQDVDIEAAKKEGKVVVYGLVPPKSMAAINKTFEAKYGIKVEYWRAAPNTVLDRVLTEWRAGHPGFDVVESNRASQLLTKQEGVFAKFVPAPSEKFPAQFREKDGLITPWRFNPVSVLYNTELVKGKDIPRRLEDLTDPKWKKKITFPDPSQHTSTAQFLYNLKHVMGSGSQAFIKQLTRQEPHLVESYAPVANALVRGEAQVGITYVKYVKQYKGPLNFVMLDNFLADSNYLGLSAKSPNPNAARVYIDYMTSAEGQKAIAEAGEFVLYPGITPDIRDADMVTTRTIFMDAPTKAEFKQLRQQFRDLFFGK